MPFFDLRFPLLLAIYCLESVANFSKVGRKKEIAAYVRFCEAVSFFHLFLYHRKCACGVKRTDLSPEILEGSHGLLKPNVPMLDNSKSTGKMVIVEVLRACLRLVDR